MSASNPTPPTKKSEKVRRLSMRVLHLSMPHWKLLASGFAALTIASGITLLFPYLIRHFLNTKLGPEFGHDLPWITALLVLLFAVQACFFYVRHYCFTAAGFHVVNDLRSTLFRALLSQEVAYFDQSRLGDLISRLSADTQLVQRAVTINLSVAARYALQVLGGLVLMLALSWKLSFVVIALVPVMLAATKVWGNKLRALSKKMQAQLGESTIIAEETLGALRTVRVFAGEEHEIKRFGVSLRDVLQTGLARTRVAAQFSSTMVFFMHSAIAIVVWLGGELVLRGSLSLGDLTAFLLYGVIVAVSLGFLAGVWDEFQQAVGASERIFEIIDRRPEISSPTSPRPIPSSGANISFQNVSFAYPARPDRVVLHDISFTLEPGKSLALVGPSGSGKSTIASLIPRYYDPTSGSVKYCGVPIEELNLNDLRNCISVVAQTPQVFSVSIRENIRYGNLDADSTAIERAAEAANLSAFIRTLPEGLDTLVGDKGIQLSGGERQRLAIARAILKNPKLLILDEATSSLDSENEQLVQQALERLMKERTTLVIAHRLSTIQHADQVLVMKDGSIVQRGTHQSLLGEVGLYKTLVDHQLL